MTHFEEILQTVGAFDRKPLAQTTHWDFWRVVYQTPAQPIKAYYLYLKHSCTATQAASVNLRSWRSLTSDADYDIIIAPKSPLRKRLKILAEKFGGRSASTSTDFLHRTMARGLSLREIDVEHYFIEPDIQTKDETVLKAVSGLIAWFDGNQRGSGSLGVVRADGGTGKTTLARRLAAEVRTLRPKVVPLLIEADQWRHQLQAEFRIPNVWDIALTRCLSAPSGLLSNETAFRVLVREGLIWVIFDGFDELCLHPQFSTSPPDVIQSFIDDLATQDEARSSARILLTSRDTYWQSYEQQMPKDGVDEFLLLGFSNDQKKEYFTKRLRDSAKVHNALRYCSEIGGRLYEGVPHEEQNKELRW